MLAMLASMKTFFILLLLSAKSMAAINPTTDWSLQEVLVAVIDTGADRTHPDLQNSWWVNKGEIPNNGIDDDRNGFVDDVSGWDFTKDSPIVVDHHGHGTHVTGIIHKLAPNARFLQLKYYDEKSSGENNLSDSIKAIHYAIKMGARIINYSGGGPGFNPEERRALDLARQKNILVICAAGNQGQNTDMFPFYPAAYRLSNLLAVASWNGKNNLVRSSNYGRLTVDIAAPGEEISSTLPSRTYGSMTGTSQATAFVTAAAALMMGRSKTKLTPEQIKEKIVKSGDYDEAFVSLLKNPVRLNVRRAFNSID